MAYPHIPKKEKMMANKDKMPPKVTHTERKPISLDKPQVSSNQIQVHTGNIQVLIIKFLESINNGVQDLVKMYKEKNG